MAKRKTGPRSSAPRKHAAAATAAVPPREELVALVNAYQQGRYEDVVRGARRFTRDWPDQAVGWNLLAEGLRLTGRLDEAESACRRALQVDPRNAEARNNLGNVLRDRGDPEGAEVVYREALARKPELVETRYNLAGVLRTGGRVHEALALYRDAIARRPDEPLYHAALGTALKEAGEFEAARDALRQALSLQPDAAETLNDLGNVLHALGCFEEARTAFEQALALRPGLLEAHDNLGGLLRNMGEPEAAQAHFRQALAIDPDHAPSWYGLSLTKTFTADDPDIAALEERLARTDLEEEAALRLHFALGKALADIDAAPGRVFPYYLEGCRLKRATFDYDPERIERQFARIAECFPADGLDSPADGGDPTEAPVFVVGMPRSGTTLVEQILASHPRVHGAGERSDLGRLIASKNESSGREYPEWIEDMPPAELTLVGEHYRRCVIDPVPDAGRVVDKLPANFQYLGLIATALPNARIVHIRRDPLDTCLSCFMHLFSGWQPFSYDLSELGRYYRAYAGLMDHWREALPAGRMLELEYEQLVTEPEPQVRHLLDHCDLDWDPACLEFHATRRSVKTASSQQVREPIHRRAMGRWRKYRAHLQPLIKALGPLAPDDARESA